MPVHNHEAKLQNTSAGGQMPRRIRSKSAAWRKLGLLLAAALSLVMTNHAAAVNSAEPRDVFLQVTDSGQYILSGQPVALADLRARLRALKSSAGPINLHVTGGPKVEYRYLMPALQIVQEVGLAKVGLLNVRTSDSESPASDASK